MVNDVQQTWINRDASNGIVRRNNESLRCMLRAVCDHFNVFTTKLCIIGWASKLYQFLQPYSLKFSEILLLLKKLPVRKPKGNLIAQLRVECILWNFMQCSNLSSFCSSQKKIRSQENKERVARAMEKPSPRFILKLEKNRFVVTRAYFEWI